MAAGDSPTKTCNLALGMLSEDPIDNVDPPDNNKRGRLCRQFYDNSRRAMLNAANWREAKRQASLAEALPAPGFTYANAYPLPDDFIRFYELPEDGGLAYEIMNLAGIGRCLVASGGAPIDVTYVFDLDDCTQMSPLLVMTIATDLAALLAWPLARDMSLQQMLEGKRTAYLEAARSASAQQASNRPWDVDVLLRARR